MIEIILILVWSIIPIKLWKKKYTEIFSSEVFVVSAISLIVGAFIFAGIGSIAKHHSVETSRQNCNGDIFSLKNNIAVEGNFTLGSGFVNSSEYYYMFQKDARGGLMRIQLDASDCFIFETDHQKPHLSWQIIHYRYPKWYMIWPQGSWQSKTKYDIIVPNHTVVDRFNVN